MCVCVCIGWLQARPWVLRFRLFCSDLTLEHRRGRVKSSLSSLARREWERLAQLAYTEMMVSLRRDFFHFAAEI